MYSETSAAPTALGPRAIRDRLLLRGALEDLAESTRFPVVFGGFADGDRIVLSDLVGNQHDELRGLTVHVGWGLGGRVLQERRPRLTADYVSSRTITHDYDRPVLTEGITSLFAVPVTVGSSVTAVLYGGLRTELSIGGVSLEPAVEVARRFATKLGTGSIDRVTPGQVDHRVLPPPSDDPPRVEELRRLYAEVREVASSVSDPLLRTRMKRIETRVAELVTGRSEAREPDAAPGTLTGRQLDVLSLVALGYRNAAVGARLKVSEATVKSYMNAILHKLGATSRYEAVAIARSRNLLP